MEDKNCSPEMKTAVLHFGDSEFVRCQDDGLLPEIKNKHEAYGILAECSVQVKQAAESVKKAVGDALNALPETDMDTFTQAVDMAYDGCLGTLIAVTNMCVHARNIILRLAMYEGQEAGKTPIEALCEQHESEDGYETLHIVSEESDGDASADEQ